MIKIREYKPGDARGIGELLNNHTSYLRDFDFWLWSNRVWPDESSVVVVAEEDQKIVGHYAILPQNILIGGNEIQAGIGVHAFIDSAYRNEVPIFQISKRCYQIAKNKGIQMLYGFPNENYRLIQEKVEGWKCVSVFNAYTKVLTKGLTKNFDSKELDYAVGQDCVELKDFLELHADRQLFGIYPTIKKWMDRYDKHPQNKYVTIFLSEGGVIIAAAVVKDYLDESSNTKVGHLIDCVIPSEITWDRVNLSLESYFSDRVSELRHWPINKRFLRSLESMGYADKGFSTFFGIKILDERLLKIEDELTDVSNWNLVMGMSDVF